MREIFWHQIYPFQAILSNFGFCGRKAKPHPGWGKFFWHQIYPFQAISSNFGFCGRKAPPQDEGNFFDTRSIHFRHFWATLVFVAEKPPSGWGKIFDTWSIHFRQFQATLVFVAEKPTRGWGKIFWHQIYPFQAILSNFDFCDRKATPHPNRMREIFLTPDLSISGNFEQLWFLWQKSPPQDEGKFFDTRSIHFRQFWATLIFVTEKPPPTQIGWGKFFWHQIYPFQAILSNFGFCGRKAHPRMRENFLTSDLSISGNFEQLWFLWQKSPPPPQDEGKIFDTRSIHFRQFWATLIFVTEKPPHHPNRMREIFLTPDLSISGNFEQLWFLWQKSPPCQDEGKFFDTRSTQFRQFWATLVFVAEKPHPPRMREHFLTSDLSISGNFEQLWFLWQKSPPPQDEGKFLTSDLSISGNFEQLWFLWQKSPSYPPRMRENFLTPDLSISGNFEQLWFLWQKSPPPSFLSFCQGLGSHHTGRIPKVPILQIHTQIPAIRISSIGYQLCQLFKILTYTELQDSGSWCIWKAYRQPYHNTH